MVSVLDWWSGFNWWPHSCCGGKVCFIVDFHVKVCSGVLGGKLIFSLLQLIPS